MFYLVQQQTTSSWCFKLSIRREGPRWVLNRPDPGKQVSERLGAAKSLPVDQRECW